jgi:hypothetical protein
LPISPKPVLSVLSYYNIYEKIPNTSERDMKKFSWKKAVGDAENELSAMLRRYPGQRPPDLIVQLLERQENLKSLGRVSADESSIVKEYMIGYVALGYPKTAARMADDLGISIDWKRQNEFVRNGYSNISAGIIRMIKLSNRIDKDYLNRLECMRKLTGIQIHDEAHFAILKAISDKITFTSKKNYILAAGRRDEGEEHAVELYSKEFYASDEKIKNVLRLFKYSGTAPSAKMKAAFLKYFEYGFEKKTPEGYNRKWFPTFEKIESCLVLFTENETGDAALARLPEGIASACFKLSESGKKGEMLVLTEKEKIGLLNKVFTFKGTHVIDLELCYLKKHGADMLFDQESLKARFGNRGDASESSAMERYRVMSALALMRDKDFLASLLQRDLQFALKLNYKSTEAYCREVIRRRRTELITNTISKIMY